jgi:Cu/Ag efflux protein CusF
MKALLISIAAAGLVAVPMAKAEQQQGSTPDRAPPATSSTRSSSTQTQPSDSSMSQTPSSSSSSTSQGSTSPSASSQTGTTASATNEVSGVVKKVDKDKKSLKVSLATGSEQDLKVADSATITRDGSQAALDQIKEGDQVRASFDASGNQASRIEVNSKQKAKMDGKDKSDSKSDSDLKSDSKSKY